MLSTYLVLFPKNKKHTLGKRLDDLTLLIIEEVIRASYLRKENKKQILYDASINLDLLKILVRLSWESKFFNYNKYQQLSAQLVEIGRMLGGWIKNVAY